MYGRAAARRAARRASRGPRAPSNLFDTVAASVLDCAGLRERATGQSDGYLNSPKVSPTTDDTLKRDSHRAFGPRRAWRARRRAATTRPPTCTRMTHVTCDADPDNFPKRIAP